MEQLARDPPSTPPIAQVDAPIYYPDGLIPVNHNEAPIIVHDDPRLATFEGQKVVISDNPEKEAGLPPPPAAQTAATLPSAVTICGLRRRTFYIILAVGAVLLIGAIAGLAGGLTSRRNNGNAESGEGLSADAESSQSPSATPSASTSSSTPRPPVIHDSSQLGACRSTNDTVTASYVIYQDPVGSLMLAAWDSRNGVWASFNISDRMLKASLPIRPKLGTPLACVTGYHTEVHVMFIDEENVVRNVYTSDGGQYQSWKKKGLYEGAKVPAHAQSRLAAYWLRCSQTMKCPSSEDGQPSVRMFFENEPGNLVTYIGAPWVQLTNFSATGREGSGLATTPYYRSDDDVTRLMFFFDTGEKLGMMTRKNANQKDWAFDETFAGATHATFPGQQIAATAFKLDETPVTDWSILAVQLEQDGSVTASYWDPRVDSGAEAEKWTFGARVEFVGGVQPAPAFKGIAVNIDGKFYGVADGAILEYLVDKTNVTRFEYIRTVAS